MSLGTARISSTNVSTGTFPVLAPVNSQPRQSVSSTINKLSVPQVTASQIVSSSSIPAPISTPMNSVPLIPLRSGASQGSSQRPPSPSGSVRSTSQTATVRPPSPTARSALLSLNNTVPPSPRVSMSFPQTPPSPQVSMGLPPPSPRASLVEVLPSPRASLVQVPPSPRASLVEVLPSPRASLVQVPPSPRASLVQVPPSPRSVSLSQVSPSPHTASMSLASLSSQQVSIPQPTSIASSRGSLLSPPIRSSGSPFLSKPTAEIMTQGFEIKDYQGIIANKSLELELLNMGYAPLSKVIVRSGDGDKRTQYIKALNKKGQKVFILVDVSGFTTAREKDLTLIQVDKAQIIPYSIKTGAYNCAGTDVCGVAFECGSDSVCVLTRGANDLTPKESNFVYIQEKANTQLEAGAIDDSSATPYPVVRLSEIRANPDLVLANTDIVTRRLRNEIYKSELDGLAVTETAIRQLNDSFINFNRTRELYARKLTDTLSELEGYNDRYMKNPPTTDEGKDRYRRLQYNLAQRNEGITELLKAIDRVNRKAGDISAITSDINAITEYCNQEFANIDGVLSD